MAKAKLSRRKFMLSVGAGTAVAAAAVAGKAVSKVAEPQAKAADTHKGYELSEHVRKYYRTTLV